MEEEEEHHQLEEAEVQDFQKERELASPMTWRRFARVGPWGSRRCRWGSIV